jgi:hypothetical protein
MKLVIIVNGQWWMVNSGKPSTVLCPLPSALCPPVTVSIYIMSKRCQDKPEVYVKSVPDLDHSRQFLWCRQFKIRKAKSSATI